MINLLPPTGHKIVKQEYFFRVGSSLCLLFASVNILLTIALVPTYVLVDAQVKSLEAESPEEGASADASKASDAEIKKTQQILKQLKTTKESVLSSTAIAEIQKYAPDTIAFSNFQVATSKGAIDSIQVQGVAPTREVLSHFKEALEQTEVFQKAEVPLSDLAKDTNLPFALTVTLTRKK